MEQPVTIHPHITACKGLFIAGFFCPIIWLGTLHFRDSPDKSAQKWKRYSLFAFAIVSLLLFCIFWLACIIVFSVDAVRLPLLQFANQTQVQFPADLMALLYAIAFGIIIIVESSLRCCANKRIR